MTVAEKLTRAKADYDEVYEAGKKAEYDRFWDAYQENGKPKQYFYAFAGIGWTDETFKPKHDIIFNQASNLNAFQYCLVTDLVKSLNDCGVVLDTSLSTNNQALFAYAETKTLPTIDCSLSSSMVSLFDSCKKLETIEKWILSTKSNAVYRTAFSKCENLKNIIVEGEMINDLDLQYSPLLSKASIESIVGCLSDTATGKTLTLSRAAVEAAFPEGSIIKQEVKLNPFTFDLATLEAQGYMVTDNGDGSVTVDGGTEGSSGYVEFFGGSLPAGTYEVSYLEEGSGISLGLTVASEYNAFPVNSGETHQITLEADDTLCLTMDLMDAYSDRKMTVTLKNLVTWDSLVATKPNWTITLV